jgi:hypothetical protein
MDKSHGHSERGEDNHGQEQQAGELLGKVWHLVASLILLFATIFWSKNVS